jgi:tRNA(Ile)-lysidine synthase
MVREQVRAFAQEHHMFPKGGKVLAAVSGGADSMCLLHVLWKEGKRQGFSLAAATFDHQIRPTSAQEAEFVRRWCQQREIPCYVGRGAVPAWAQEHNMGLEEAARSLRYEFLQTIAAEIGADKIATAHNADDNAETLLLHLVRGSGLKGLGGIPPLRDNLIRPLLTTSRREIEHYLQQWDIPHVEDESNQDTAYSRNYIRHEVLPLLRAKNPNLLEGWSRSAESLRQDSDYLEREAENLSAKAVFSGGKLSFPAAELAQLHEALSNRVVQHMAQRLDSSIVLSYANRKAALQLCQRDDPSAQAALTGGLTAGRVYDQFVLFQGELQHSFDPVVLAPGKQVQIGERFLSCQWAVCPGGKFNQPNEFYLRSGEVLLLRPRRTGDEITLPSRNRKTVKKLLIDSKISRQRRELIAVLEIDGVLAGVDGFGADTAFLPKAGERCWKITGTPADETLFGTFER